MPAIISALSVVLNVVIISALIPAMKNDIAVMQGQAGAIQNQVNSFTQSVNSMQTSLLYINDKVNGADTRISAFYSNLNATEAAITAFQDSTQADLQHLQNTSALLLTGFHQSSADFQQRLSSNLTAAEQRTDLLQQQVADAQKSLQSSMTQLLSVDANLTAKAAFYFAAADSSLQLLRATNDSAVEQVESLRSDFVQRVVPQVTADLQSLNQSAEVSLLRDDLGRMVALNLSASIAAVAFTDPPHYVGDAATGLGSVFLGGWSAPQPERRVRFWRDRNVVHVEGYTTTNTACAGSCDIFRLPVGYRPANNPIYPVYSSAVQYVSIDTEGMVRGSVNGHVATSIDAAMLSGISFSVVPQP